MSEEVNYGDGSAGDHKVKFWKKKKKKKVEFLNTLQIDWKAFHISSAFISGKSCYLLQKKQQYTSFFQSSRERGQGSAQWWKHSLSANMARVQFPDPLLYADWVCWFSALFWEVFPQVVRFSPLTKKKDQDLIWFVVIQFDLQSPQLVKPLCLVKSIKT